VVHNSPACDKYRRGAGNPAPTPTEIDQRTTSSLVYLNVGHGYYYWDVGFVLAEVPNGQRHIDANARPGIPGDHAIAVTPQTEIVTGLALNLFPGGHRRGVDSRFEPKARALDMFGLQLAFAPTRHT
jgi:hypothetical protein